MKLTEPRYNSRSIWPVVYITGLLFLSLLGESFAQDKITVDRWRLEKACKELVLLDSLVKDYALKDSTVITLKGVISDLRSEIEHLKKANDETQIRVDNQIALNERNVLEINRWRSAYNDERKKRFNVSVGLSYQPLNKHSFGPAVTVGYSLYKF